MVGVLAKGVNLARPALITDDSDQHEPSDSGGQQRRGGVKGEGVDGVRAAAELAG
jgi:hypothetical protein